MIIDQGKAAEAAALGKRHPHPILSFFQSGLARQTRLEKREADHLLISYPGRRSFLSCPDIILSSLRDFSLARSARVLVERPGSGTPGQ